jgi:hypothetical protein
MPWEKTKFPGIQMKILCSEPSTGLSTILFKMDPGAGCRCTSMWPWNRPT